MSPVSVPPTSFHGPILLFRHTWNFSAHFEHWLSMWMCLMRSKVSIRFRVAVWDIPTVIYSSRRSCDNRVGHSGSLKTVYPYHQHTHIFPRPTRPTLQLHIGDIIWHLNWTFKESTRITGRNPTFWPLAGSFEVQVLRFKFYRRKHNDIESDHNLKNVP